MLKHSGLDHIAIVVENTDAALELWSDVLGFPVVHSETVNDGTIRLTHLDLGNTHLQLVEPLATSHPLRDWLKQHGSGLHHFCLKVCDVTEAMEKSPVPVAGQPHQGIQGKRALFLDPSHTQGVRVEFTGP